MSTKAGDIVLLNLDPPKGGEKNKTRPCLILVGSGHPWKIIIALPITDLKSSTKSKKLFVSIPSTTEGTGLLKNSCVDCFQIRCLDEGRVLKKLGVLPASVLDEIRSRVAIILNIGGQHVQTN